MSDKIPDKLKIAVIGNPGTVIGFKALGLETYSATTGSEAGAIMKALTRGTAQSAAAPNGSPASGAPSAASANPSAPAYAVIYIEEALAAEISDEISRFKDAPLPAIIVIPGPDGSLGTGMAALNAAVERAVGMNIL